MKDLELMPAVQEGSQKGCFFWGKKPPSVFVKLPLLLNHEQTQEICLPLSFYAFLHPLYS